MKDPVVQEQLETISKSLDVALEFGLELEVIYSALEYIKKNPAVSPAEAFVLGVAEWVK